MIRKTPFTLLQGNVIDAGNAYPAAGDANCKLFVRGSEWAAGATFVESSPVGRTVNLVNAPTEYDDRYWEFDGVDQYLYCADHADFNINATWTFDLYMRTSMTPSVPIMIAGQWGDNGQLGYGIFMNPAGSMSFLFSDTGFGPLYYSVDSVTTVNDDAWHHIAYTREANNLRWWVDGIYRGNYGNSVTFKNSTAQFQIGGNSYSYLGGYFQGWVEEVRLINGTALWNTSADFNRPLRGQTA